MNFWLAAVPGRKLQKLANKINGDQRKTHVLTISLLDMDILSRLRTCSYEEFETWLTNSPDFFVNFEFPYAGGGSFTLLHKMVIRKNPRFVKLLLDRGANVHALGSCSIVGMRVTPLQKIFTCDPEYHTKRFEVCDLLIEHGADVNGTTTTGYTALELAVQLTMYDDDKCEAIKYLLSRGADPSVRDSWYCSSKVGRELLNGGGSGTKSARR